MKFTDSPVIELPVGNAVLSLQQDNGSMHVGTSVWPCSLVLVKFLDRWAPPSPNNPYAQLLNFQGKRAIELGTGCGVAGMGLYLLGLTDLVLTDIAPVMPALKRNLKVNKPILNKTLKHSVLYWNNPQQIASLNPPFDFVIATDVVYIEESVPHLISAMETLVSDDGVVLLGYQLRSPEAHKLFWELCDNVFDVERVPHDHLHPDYAYEEADVFLLRKKRKLNIVRPVVYVDPANDCRQEILEYLRLERTFSCLKLIELIALQVNYTITIGAVFDYFILVQTNYSRKQLKDMKDGEWSLTDDKSKTQK